MKSNISRIIFAILGIIISFLMISGSFADGIHYTVGSNEKELFNNWNIGGVSSGPSSYPSFTISSPAQITYIDTYHWNGGKGAKPGTIALKNSDGTIYGPWDAYPSPWHKSTDYTYWTVEPNVKIKAGTYQIIDSDPKTWSYNSQSKSLGFAAVKALKGSVTIVPITEPPTVENTYDLIGTWSYSASGVGGKLIITSQTENGFSGTISGYQITNGKINGDAISFRQLYGTAHQDFKGTIKEKSNGDLIIEGSFITTTGATKSWNATKQ